MNGSSFAEASMLHCVATVAQKRQTAQQVQKRFNDFPFLTSKVTKLTTYSFTG